MNGIDRIVAKIAEDAEAAARSIREASDAACSEIADKFKAEAEKEAAQIKAAGEKDSEAAARRMEGASQMKMRMASLSMKQELMGRVFDMAEEKLLSMPPEEYADFLAGLAARASVSGKEELIFDEKDAALAEAVAAAANALLEKSGKKGLLKVSSEYRPLGGGIFLQEGKVETNCSVRALVDMNREKLSSEVAEILFG